MGGPREHSSHETSSEHASDRGFDARGKRCEEDSACSPGFPHKTGGAGRTARRIRTGRVADESSEGREMSGESILIVDDNVDNLELTQILLESEGFEVRVAEDAGQALERLRTYRPRLILMDVQLPGMDGLELTRQLRQDASLREVIIVALTAYAMKGDEDDARAAGCD